MYVIHFQKVSIVYHFFKEFEQEIYVTVLYVPPILGQLLDLISPAKINISEPRFKSYDPWDMAN